MLSSVESKLMREHCIRSSLYLATYGEVCKYCELGTVSSCTTAVVGDVVVGDVVGDDGGDDVVVVVVVVFTLLVLDLVVHC